MNWILLCLYNILVALYNVSDIDIRHWLPKASDVWSNVIEPVSTLIRRY